MTIQQLHDWALEEGALNKKLRLAVSQAEGEIQIAFVDKNFVNLQTD